LGGGGWVFLEWEEEKGKMKERRGGVSAFPNVLEAG